MKLDDFKLWFAGVIAGCDGGGIGPQLAHEIEQKLATVKAESIASAHEAPADARAIHVTLTGGEVVHLHERYGRSWVVSYDLPNDAFVCRQDKVGANFDACQRRTGWMDC
ncbi:hypothetical protein [Methylobacterium sp. R2-1]|uniref:hypothetical protein n=1 Tax=Methylobacterium sp. R2-1 TaxID=2587064 RepID=UPI00160D87FA|nr:hypothetical protein [Methylobacterium sp. R2-1]MBB2959851.1 hypothetical protein [Methylobacterium sp. R2-1]